MIYVGGISKSRTTGSTSTAEDFAVALSNPIALSAGQLASVKAEILRRGIQAQPVGVILVELSKSASVVGTMPRTECDPGIFQVVCATASSRANAGTAQQKAVWSMVSDPSIRAGYFEKVSLLSASIKSGMDACLSAGLLTQGEYNDLMWEDSSRDAGWVEKTFGTGYTLLPTDITLALGVV